MPSVRTGPIIGLIAQLALLAALAGTVGLSAAGWVVGVAFGAVTNAALTYGLTRTGAREVGPANLVTLVRATLVGGVAALVASWLGDDGPVATLTVLAAVALAMDALDGWVARRTGTASRLGWRFDQEVDSFLILVLSLHVAVATVWWALVIGVARYAFALAGWLLPWLRGPLPPRYWGKVVAAVQGVALVAVTASVLPHWLDLVLLLVALALLVESFGHSVRWLWTHREGHELTAYDQRSDLRAAAALVTTTLALLLVWFALVSPNQLDRLSVSAFVRIPLEALVLLAVLLALPRRVGRVLAGLAGVVLGLLTLVKVLDFGFFTALDRPFDPVADWTYTGTATETMRASVGDTVTTIALIGIALVVVAVPVLTVLAVLRLTRIASRHRRPTLRAVAALAAVWVLLAVPGTQLVKGEPVASRSAASLAVTEVRAVKAGVQDHAVFADAVARDRFRDLPADRLLTGLRGKDVIVAIVESYGKVAVHGSDIAPQMAQTLATGDRRLTAAGFSSRSAWLTSPTFGGISWLAHSTLQSGVWVNSQRRYNQLMGTDRFTLSQAFKRAGWRSVDDVPSNNRAWEQGSSYYHYDKVYDRRNVGYQGPTFTYASMPDQYVMSAFQRLELAKADRKPVFGEIDLVSSHEPWTRVPQLVPWDEVGDGSVFDTMAQEQVARNAVWHDPAQARAAYGKSVRYTMNMLTSFVQNYGNDDLVMVVLGDHQPWSVVSGQDPSHDVPISVIAKDPKVLDSISGWGWRDGLRPDPKAPVWPMSAFRNKLFTAFNAPTNP